MSSTQISLAPGTIDYFRPSFCDIKLSLRGITLYDCRKLAYADRQDTKFLWGCANTPLARVGRNTQANGELELGLETFTSLAQQLCGARVSDNIVTGVGFTTLGGFGDISFDLSVIYHLRPGTRFIKDVLQGVKFVGTSNRSQSSGKSITVTQLLSIASISWGGAQLTYSSKGIPSFSPV